MEILSGAQMRRIDARTIDRGVAASLDLMENAGRGVAVALAREVLDLARRPVVVLCGKGNNGGDGLVAARHLARLGVAPRIVLVGRAAELRGDPAENLKRAAAAGLAVEEAGEAGTWGAVASSIGRETIVLDALLGTGVSGGARGLVARAIDDVNASGATVVAIDLPSGIDADTGRVAGPAMLAHRTFTLCRPKIGLVVEPAASHAGSWAVLDIGIPDAIVAEEQSDLEWHDGAAAAALLPPRPRSAHKGTMGHLLAIAGSRGKTGAAVLVARAALRSGVGLVTVAAPRSCLPTIAAGQVEAMTEPLDETRSGAATASAAAGARALLRNRDALAVGPGLGTAPATKSFVKALLARCPAPAVVDADGLNAFAGKGRRLGLSAGSRPLVLTPHPGEAGRLLGITPQAIHDDRLGAARRLAAETRAVVVLKGARSIVADPSGRASVNATGNPGMATGGTGDALTGIVGALLARGMAGFDAARLGTYVHGDAGDRAADRLGEDGMIAGDLVAELPQSWKGLHEVRAGVERWTRGE